MSEIFATLRLLIAVGGVLVLAFLVLLSLPESRMREILMPFVGWAVSALSVAYIFMPFDIMPEGLIGPFGLADDAVALAVAIGSAMTASESWKRLKQLY